MPGKLTLGTATLALLATLFGGVAADAQMLKQPKIVFSGMLNCDSGKVQLVEGEFIKRAYPTLKAAQEALSRSFDKKGIEQVVGHLNDACKETSDDTSTPPRLENAPTGKDALSQFPGASHTDETLLLLEKIDAVLYFKLFDSVSADNQSLASYMETVNSQASVKRCRPISSVCWKCTNGRIICSTPKVEK